jgi:hypothetical protein
LLFCTELFFFMNCHLFYRFYTMNKVKVKDESDRL